MLLVVIKQQQQQQQQKQKYTENRNILKYYFKTCYFLMYRYILEDNSLETHALQFRYLSYCKFRLELKNISIQN